MTQHKSFGQLTVDGEGSQACEQAAAGEGCGWMSKTTTSLLMR